MAEKRSTFNSASAPEVKVRRPLYTPEERLRRDSTYWTFVQGLLAPIQFFIFPIMITGCIWEKVVFGRYLFAPSFYWEDVFSMLVLALHTGYLYAMYTQKLQGVELMYLALAAYATYVVNAGQFILKLRAARLDQEAKLREATAVKHEGFQGVTA